MMELSTHLLIQSHQKRNLKSDEILLQISLSGRKQKNPYY